MDLPSKENTRWIQSTEKLMDSRMYSSDLLSITCYIEMDPWTQGQVIELGQKLQTHHITMGKK